jgi:hypothetical protein
MKSMAAAVAGAMISGVAMYAVGAGAAQDDTFVETPALVQTLDGQYVAAALRPDSGQAAQPRLQFVSNTPGTTSVVRTEARPQAVYRPAQRVPARQTVYEDDVVYRDEEVRQERSKTKTALIIGGSAASGAGVGAIVGGKKGALIGAAIGGGAASIYEATKRR